ncbi:hypothetical protein [Xenorhabdus hominickii]|uniref:Uncharacterized protein n=1 Tax=Xenorhabdus hominickii TaxID=351679 RepID=A0ABM6DN24_XENHO|nr:hypothetical protein [Xenorhabdus hominickii]AOM39280.1 hypothetical protein A9255_00795 [Xenorhabdus hominickii]
MTENKQVEINLRILTRKAPAVHRNRPTLFGLQEKEKFLLHSGKELNGLLAFDTKVRIKDVDGMARCFGSQVPRSMVPEQQNICTSPGALKMVNKKSLIV